MKVNNYKVYFEFLGKKMQMSVDAVNRYDAEDIVRNKIIIHSVKLIEGQEKSESMSEEMQSENVEFLKGMFGFK
jgi:hypothetical protein